MMTQKIFGVGFHKTGTKSLGMALNLLGYKVCSHFGTRDEDIAKTALPRAIAIAKEYDAFQDNPWPILYKEMDMNFPGSKFILTICPDDEWIKRAVRYFGAQETPMRQWIYGVGSPLGHEEIYLQRYKQHNANVQNYFAQRPDDLLVFPLTTNPTWSELCNFLKRPLPEAEIEFPHLNKGHTC